MTENTNINISSHEATQLIAELCMHASKAQLIVGQAVNDARNTALRHTADLIRRHYDAIHNANVKDINAGQDNGLTDAFIDRLTLDKDRVEAMANGLEAIADLGDPLGVELARWVMPNGLDITRLSTALGILGIIYESRPNVTIDAAGLSIKSGNACILRAGSDSYHTAKLLAQFMRDGLDYAALPADAVQIIPTADRAVVTAMLEAVGQIDVIIPRGGKGLVERVKQYARVPVFAHLEGICHLYVSQYADRQKAIDICINAKMRRVGICGAAETILIDKKALHTHGQEIVDALIKSGCEVRGDPQICTLNEAVIPARSDDWGREFLAPIIAMAVTDNLEEAITHIRKFGSGHTESILSENTEEKNRFFAQIDSAIVMANTSTQFADGGEFGMGAEIGIATGKLHARGPVGAAQLTSFKYIVNGDGQIRH